ncbi:proline-rich protein 2-like [Bufo bufo]|uniref:proline-rich protein 2-like n=1 Tax=Bufo bufo TaxID=8384 RepID=UPI001ABD9E40|nr:proline-rich protein 2-like [Bufo bufo]
MKSLIFLAIVVQALAGPFGKHEKPRPSFGPPHDPRTPKPSHESPTGLVHPSEHHNLTGQSPHDNPSQPRHPEGLEGHPRHSRQVSKKNQPKGTHPPAGGHRPSKKPPTIRTPQNKPGQGPRPTPKQNDAKSHPTAAPHVAHTHPSAASRPQNPTHSAKNTQKKLGQKNHKG